jgi:hypothetical protein
VARPKHSKTPELCEAVLERVEAGEVLAKVCEDHSMPSWSAFKEWMQQDESLAAAYARACECGVALNEDELLREARRKPADSVDATGQRTLVDTLKWRLSKRLPRDFGDRQQVEHSGTIGDGLTEAQRAQRIAEILRAAAGRPDGEGK